MKNQLHLLRPDFNHLSFFVRTKIAIILLFILSHQLVLSQNVGVLSAVSPVSGCELSNNQFVTIVIFNYGTVYSGSFDVSFVINGGIPVTETVTLASFPATSTYAYTFAAVADLSTANNYNFKFYTNLVGDINNNNDTLSNVIVRSDTLTYGGVLDASVSVCYNNNNGNLNLNSSLGNVQFWESSTNGGVSWNNVANTSTSLNYYNISAETWYRAISKNGLCPRDTSSIAILSIDSPSVGGVISGSTTVCYPNNNGALVLSGERGNLIDWEFSANGGSTWNRMLNLSDTLNYVNLPSTHLYRTVVQNGSCPISYSAIAEVTVMNQASGGVVLPSTQTVCSGTNVGNLNLNGYTGIITNWQISTNNGASWTTLANNLNTLSFAGLTQETWYRTLVSGCNNDTSSIAKILVDDVSVGGILTPNRSVCINANSGTISLTGIVGNVTDWEQSVNGGVTWNSLSNNTSTFNFNNLTVTTMYRALVSNGYCVNVYSDTSIVTVNTLPVSGMITGPSNVCMAVNNGVLSANGSNGSILGWQSSINGGLTWNSLGNTSSTCSFVNLNQNTLFQVVSTNGVCPNDSSQYLLTVDSPSDAGSLNFSDSVCYLSSGIKYLSGYTGIVTGWEYSDNDGVSWYQVQNYTDTFTYSNLESRNLYRTFVKNGSCNIDTSNVIVVDIYPNNVGISNDTTITLGESVVLSAFGGTQYSWSPSFELVTPNNATSITTPSETTRYTVDVIDLFGCFVSASVLVNVIEPIINPEIVIAEVITPNGDGFNDVWKIIAREKVNEIKVMVFNRWGILVFESSNYQNDWGGTYKSSSLPNGTYFYVVEFTDDPNVRKGKINLY